MSDYLVGCWAKLDRAEENIQNLDHEIAEFLQSGISCEINAQHRESTNEYVFIASGESKTPARFAVLAGEIVHQLRSSLDHLIQALVFRNGGTESDKCQFPICTKKEAFKRAC